jgi:AcrR family transcriptional regulator
MSAAGPPPADRVVRRRPKDRKAQIAKASADAFSAQGYHAVSMEDIASRVGITAGALYRHSESKYELFRDAVLALGQQLVDATAFADDEQTDANPVAVLRHLIAALIETAIANRTAGGLYRWEARYLLGDDRDTLAGQIKLVNRRLQRPLAALRPKLGSHERWTLSAATLSVIGSFTDHRSQLAAAEVRTTLAEMATNVLNADLPTRRTQQREPGSARNVTAAAGSYELVLHESMRLFNERGYRETTMEDIATAVGMPASGIYRYFPGKAEILAASYRRAADRLSSDLSEISAATDDAEQALAKLVDAYVSRSLVDPGPAYVYYTERNNLPKSDAVVLLNVHRSIVESWARLTVAARPDLSLGHARYGVHAAFALAVDLGRMLEPANNGAQSHATLARLMAITLLGRPVKPARQTDRRSRIGR